MPTPANVLTSELLVEIPRRFPNIRVWRSNRIDALLTGAGGRLRRVKAGIDGQADISGIVGPTGRRCEIEVKAGKDRLSLDQYAFQHMIESHGGLYLIARDLDGTLAKLQAVLG